ncbi:MAG: alpha/beta fold hydrolase [Candidatus Margulisiibacteriota bacterium]
MLDLIKDERNGIQYFKWTVKDPAQVFLLIHGMGAHSERWRFFAEYLLKKNSSSYSLELRGFGQTADYKGHIDSLDTYYHDIARIIEIIKSENPGKKIILAGESMGGLIGFEFLLKYPLDADALVCFSPAFANNMKLNFSGVILPLFYNIKKQNLMPFTSSMCTRDTDYQKVMDADPREHRFATSALLLQILFAQIRSTFFANKMEKPVLFLLAGDDKDLLVDPKAAKKVFRRMIGSACLPAGRGLKPARTGDIQLSKLIQYPDMLHALSIEVGREKVFEDVVDWINALIPLPFSQREKGDRQP